MIVSRTITKDVIACNQCPWFDYHPQEASCDKMRELGAKAYEDIVPHYTIATNCPLKKERE